MSYLSDKSIWLLFVEGDMNAFATLFKLFYSSLHNYGMKISNNVMLTEDCLQSFFIYLHENHNNLGTVHNVKTYLFVSYRRALLKSIKQERKFTSYDEALEKSNAFEFSAEELLVTQEFTRIKTDTLTHLLNSLTIREREAIYLKYYSELTIKDITEVMNISYQSVLNTLQKAFIKLRGKLETHEIRQAFNLN